MTSASPRFGVSYFGNRFVRHAKADLDEISEICDYVVHTVSETDLIFHKSVLAKIFAESRKRKLEIWADPWGLGGVFGGEALSKFLMDNRDTWQTMSDGRVVPAACMNRPEWRAYVKEWVLNIRELGAQVVFWDEPHVSFDVSSEYEGIYSCVCAVCQSLFKKQYGSALPSKLTETSRRFRRDTIKGFLEDMMTFAHTKGLKNALCLYAFRGHKEYDQVWTEAAGMKNLDIFGCDPYWRWRGTKAPAPYVGEYARYVVETAKPHKLGSQIWIQAMRLPSGTEGEVEKAIQAAVEQGVTHIAAWSFDGGELLDTVLSERPERVWKSVENAFRSMRKK